MIHSIINIYAGFHVGIFKVAYKSARFIKKRLCCPNEGILPDDMKKELLETILVKAFLEYMAINNTTKNMISLSAQYFSERMFKEKREGEDIY